MKNNKTDTPPQGTALFFTLALGINWLACLPAVLAQRGVIAGTVESFMPLLAIALFGPLLAAVVTSFLEARGAGVRTLFRPLREWRAAPGWYLVALLFPGAVLGLGMAAYRLFGGTGALVYLPKAAPAVVAMLLVPWAEEIGWRGLAYPRLLQRYGALNASLVLGVLWALWHTGFFMLTGIPLVAWLLMLPYFMVGSVILSWLYHRPGGGLPIVILAHMGTHLSNSNQALPGNVTPLLVQTIGFCLMATFLVVRDSKPWRRVSQENPPFVDG